MHTNINTYVIDRWWGHYFFGIRITYTMIEIQSNVMFNISDDTVAWMEGDFVSKEVPDVAEEREFIYLG